MVDLRCLGGEPGALSFTLVVETSCNDGETRSKGPADPWKDIREELAEQAGVVCAVIGEVGGESLSIACSGEELISESVALLEGLWRGALPQALDRPMQMAAD